MMEFNNIEEDTEVGLHPCTFTGVVFEEEDGYFVEVVLPYGVTQPARLSFPFPLIAAVNKEWVAKHKDSLVGLVAFEQGKPEDAVLVHVSFKGEYLSLFDDFPNSVTLLSEIFKFQLNDKQKKAYLQVNDGTFHIGSSGAKEPLLLGDTTIEKLEQVIDQLSALCDALAALTVTCTAPGSPSSPPVNFASFLTVKSQIAAIKTSLSATKSKKAFVE